MSLLKLRLIAVAALLAGAATLGGCIETTRLSPDYGEAVRQNVAAQVADPDAHYAGTPAPGSNGARVGLAQDRYEKGKVIPPSDTGASSITVGGSSGGQ